MSDYEWLPAPCGRRRSAEGGPTMNAFFLNIYLSKRTYIFHEKNVAAYFFYNWVVFLIINCSVFTDLVKNEQ